jgi:hypothetical protein
MRTQAKPLDIGGGRAMRLGFVVKVLCGGGLPSHDGRRWRPGPHLRVSLERLRGVLEYCDAHDMRMYRMATAVALRLREQLTEPTDGGAWARS